MQRSSMPGSGPWSWLEPSLWVYRSRELDLLDEADQLLQEAAPAARAGGAALLAQKRRIHAAGIGAATAPADAGGGGHRFVAQVAIQFLAGYRDLNLRDVAHVGHGAILCRDPEWRGRREVAEVINGALIGLAATEPPDEPAPEPADETSSTPPHRPPGAASSAPSSAGSGPLPDQPGMSAVQTQAVPVPGGWRITGRKKWISRVVEASAFVVFARSPEHLAAFHVPAGTPGLAARPLPPAGFAGWSRGELELDGVTVPPAAVIGSSVGGIAVFRRHFTEYRPLVAATCLGAAAACVDAWVEQTIATAGGRPVGNAVTQLLADLRGRLLLALSGLVAGAARPSGVDGPWSKLVKSQAVQTSLDAARTAARNIGDDRDTGYLVHRIAADLEAFDHTDVSIDPLLQSADRRFVEYSAAIRDEISEPTSTLRRPDLG